MRNGRCHLRYGKAGDHLEEDNEEQGPDIVWRSTNANYEVEIETNGKRWRCDAEGHAQRLDEVEVHLGLDLAGDYVRIAAAIERDSISPLVLAVSHLLGVKHGSGDDREMDDRYISERLQVRSKEMKSTKGRCSRTR